MFSPKPKPLPAPILQPVPRKAETLEPSTFKPGIVLGPDLYWSPQHLPNGHAVVIGASGSGKTQTLKALAYELGRTYANLQLVIIDFHGDQQLLGETAYPLHMNSPWGINPLVLNRDPEGGGPNLQAIALAQTLKRTLHIGPNQEGLVIEALKDCYHQQGITAEPSTWNREPPTFAHLQSELTRRSTDTDQPCKESGKLLLKLAATFAYGIFNRPAFPLQERLIRLDLCKLPPEVGAIAAEALAKQLMDAHRLLGETKTARTYLFIDEAKEMTRSPALDRIVCDGRKYGLNLVLASQSERHLSPDVLSNSATKIVLPVDQVEVEKVAKKFRFSPARVAQLQPLQALCRLGSEAVQTHIIPYYRRVQNGSSG